MDEVRARMARELAPYQGRARRDPRPVGDPVAGLPGHVPSPSPDAGTDAEVEHVYRPLSESVPEAGGVLLPPTFGARRRR